jgi:hypothetical protein
MSRRDFEVFFFGTAMTMLSRVVGCLVTGDRIAPGRVWPAKAAVHSQYDKRTQGD